MRNLLVKTDGRFQGIEFPEAEIGFMVALAMHFLGVKPFPSYFTLHIDLEQEEFSLTPNARGLLPIKTPS